MDSPQENNRNPDITGEIEGFNPDLIVKGSIEEMFYGRPNKELVSGYNLLGGFGVLIRDMKNKQNVLGFVVIRTEVINPKTNESVFVKVLFGLSKEENRDKLRPEDAYRQAFKNYAEKVLKEFSKKN